MEDNVVHEAERRTPGLPLRQGPGPAAPAAARGGAGERPLRARSGTSGVAPAWSAEPIESLIRVGAFAWTGLHERELLWQLGYVLPASGRADAAAAATGRGDAEADGDEQRRADRHRLPPHGHRRTRPDDGPGRGGLTKASRPATASTIWNRVLPGQRRRPRRGATGAGDGKGLRLSHPWRTTTV